MSGKPGIKVGGIKPSIKDRLALLVSILISKRSVPAWLCLIAGLSFTALAWQSLVEQQKRSASKQFNLHVQQINNAIHKRLYDHELILLGAAGLTNVKGIVTREQWRTYVSQLSLTDRYPGIQGVGFSQFLLPIQLDEHIAVIRAEGFPDYTIKPAGQRDAYTSIIYLEPFQQRNLAAFGYDMFSEPVRREAMQRAVDQHTTAITGKVRLVQETYGKEQAGFLMYIPVFGIGQPVATAAQRWQSLLGFVYSPYRMDDLMDGIFNRTEMLVEFQLYDGTGTEVDQLMYDSSPIPIADQQSHRYQAQRQIEEFGWAWTLRVHSRTDFQQQFESALDWLLPFLGIGISLSLFGLVAVLLNRRASAQALADLMMVRHQQATQRFHQLFLNMEQGVTIHNHEGHLVDANPAAQRILGLSHQALTDIYADKAGIPAQHEDGSEFSVTDQPLWTAISQQKSINDTVIGFQHPHSQAWHWISVDVYPYIDSSTHTIEIYQVFTDITETKRVERLKSEFVATVSHELRTPLTAISGALGLISSGAMGALPDKIQQMTDIANNNCKRLALLINDILDIEKMSAGQMQYHLEQQTLNPLLAQAIEAHQTYSAKQQVQLDLNTPDTPIEVTVDSQRLMQVLANLLSNAIKFSPPGGKVSLNVQLYPNKVRICVNDQGSGVPIEFQNRLFERFAQADSSDTRQKGGTGLGLSISRELVQAMGGTIGYQDAPDQGASFWFELPTN